MGGHCPRRSERRSSAARPLYRLTTHGPQGRLWRGYRERPAVAGIRNTLGHDKLRAHSALVVEDLAKFLMPPSQAVAEGKELLERWNAGGPWKRLGFTIRGG